MKNLLYTRSFSFSNAMKLNIVLLLVALISTLLLPLNHDIWRGFSDVYDYLRQSELELSVLNFWIPEYSAGFYPRPFVVPLFYKVLFQNPDYIVRFQIVFHWLAVFYTASVLLVFFRNKISEVLFLIGWYVLMQSWFIIGWNFLLLSEGISFSLMLIWMSSLLQLLRKWRTWLFLAHIFITILFSFTRDSWPYIILLTYFGVVFFSWRWHTGSLLPKFALLAVATVLFFVQQYTAEIGNRYRLPLTNSLALRVAPLAAYLQYFEKSGMPMANAFAQKLKGINAYDSTKVRLYEFYTDSAYLPFHQWIVTKGKATYTRFLILHPGYTFLWYEDEELWNKIFPGKLFYYGGERGIAQYLKLPEPTGEPFIVLFLILVSIAGWFALKHEVYLLVFALQVFIFSHTILIYNADAMEVERHLYLNTIVLYFSIVLFVASIPILIKERARLQGFLRLSRKSPL